MKTQTASVIVRSNGCMVSSYPRTPHPFDAATKLSVIRESPPVYPPAELDPGVKFFALMLEQIGAVTHYSCEGHPNGFYITFSANYPTALSISQCGFFNVEVDRRLDYWILRMTGNEVHMKTKAQKLRTLRWAAEAWIKRFGPLKTKP